MAVRRIFISYRREDSQDVAGRIYDRLVARYGEEHVFKDVDDIPIGADFPQHIDGAVSSCAVCLVIIGPQWCTVRDGQGRRRLDAEDDFVRLEVEAALARDIPAVPVLVGGASVPGRADLPPSLHGLARRQAISVRPDPDFHTDVDRLIRGLDRLPDAELQLAHPAPGPLAWLSPWRWGALPWKVWHVVVIAACGLALVAAMAVARRSFAPGGWRHPSAPSSELERRARWKFQAPADLNSGPCVAPDGVLYLGAMDGQCYALSAEGKLLWTYRTGDGVNYAPAVGADGSVYVASWDGCLYVLDKDGRFRWKFATRGPIDSTPRFASDGAVYLTSWDRSVYAVGEGGKLQWEFATESHVSSSVALGPDGTVYVGFWDGHVYAIGPQGPSTRRGRSSGASGGSSGIKACVVGPDDAVYVTCRNHCLYALPPRAPAGWRYKE